MVFYQEGDRCYEGLLLGKTLNNKYLIEHAIGYGIQAVIFLATFQGKRFAIKCFKNSVGAYREEAENEIAMLDHLHHPNIIEKIDSFEELGNVFLVLEYCESDLTKLLINNRQVYNRNELFLQILDAVICMHGQGVFHPDMKPLNILIKSFTESTLKIADFGAATTEQLTTKRVVGSRPYVAPEVLPRREIALGQKTTFSRWGLYFST